MLVRFFESEFQLNCIERIRTAALSLRFEMKGRRISQRAFNRHSSPDRERIEWDTLGLLSSPREACIA
ncbi:hypothetical protein CEXT_735491 [Caerostris extrusa]|uniref:Uncharacterized protein n=1 Tax=Caerostris extrusa TaxID=172846 RepID=A0AAV4T5F5_CAEEX|nr:hypothetical protein CEXT_735491 [Caerostris extrusa]